MSPNKKRQAILCIGLGLFGLLGVAAQIESHNSPMAVLFGLLTGFMIGLGIWLWRS